ncbi:MAG: hypothetical protein Q8T08_14035 [Ignavibacteria bacterium]|nr:hypothetical protein [Ignavibacteria bacterium]
MEFVKQGQSTITNIKAMLKSKLTELLEIENEIDQGVDYIFEKNEYYDNGLTDEIKYTSNIIKIDY